MKYLVLFLFLITSCVPENEIGTVKAYDVNAKQKLTFNIVSGNENNAFAINNRGLITFTKDKLDKSKYELIVSVTDDGKMWNGNTYYQDSVLSSKATITINESAWKKQ